METALSIDHIYAAALAMLIEQLGEDAPMDEILASVARLGALAKLGPRSLVLTDLQSSTRDIEAAAVAGVEFLCERMNAHSVLAVHLSSGTTDSEFLKLGGLLNSVPSVVPGAIVDSLAALSIVNVQLTVAGRDDSAVPPLDAGLEAQTCTSASRLSADDIDEKAREAQAIASLTARMSDIIARSDSIGAFSTLAQIGSDEQFRQVASVTGLQLAVEEVTEQRVSAQEALSIIGRAGSTGVEAVFWQLVGATDPGERGTLMALIIDLPDPDGFIRSRLNDQSWYVARAAAAILGERGDQGSVPDLTRLLKHEDQRVRIAAVIALGHVGGTGVRSRLESVLFDPSERVRNSALSVVFVNTDIDTLPPNELVTNDEADELDTTLAMIEALKNVRTARARDRLISLVKSTGTGLDALQIRLTAMGALAMAHRSEAIAVLEELSRDPHHLIRERAVALLES